MTIRDEYKKETGEDTHYYNEEHEPKMLYVQWLESRCTHQQKAIAEEKEAHRKDLSQVIDVIKDGTCEIEECEVCIKDFTTICLIEGMLSQIKENT